MTPHEHAETLLASLVCMRKWQETNAPGGPANWKVCALRDAADLIEQQAQTIETLQEALVVGGYTNEHTGSGHHCTCSQAKRLAIIHAALAAVSRPHEDAQKP